MSFSSCKVFILSISVLCVNWGSLSFTGFFCLFDAPFLCRDCCRCWNHQVWHQWSWSKGQSYISNWNHKPKFAFKSHIVTFMLLVYQFISLLDTNRDIGSLVNYSIDCRAWLAILIKHFDKPKFQDRSFSLCCFQLMCFSTSKVLNSSLHFAGVFSSVAHYVERESMCAWFPGWED